MALSDITDSTAVLQAAEEFDALGREAFLAHYGFGKSREYFLVLSGKRYDSKAVMGAAHGYQFPEKGPLRAGDFSGGDVDRQGQARAVRLHCGDKHAGG